MSQLDLFADPPREWNPHFAAWAATIGMRPEDITRTETSNGRFINWISEQAATWCAEAGVTIDRNTFPLNPSRSAEFSTWLTDPDQCCAHKDGAEP